MADDLNVHTGWVETILKKDEYDKNIVKITGGNFSRAITGKGENYLGIMYRARLDVVHGSGRTSTLSLILKAEMTKNQAVLEIFRRENLMYQNLLKSMEIEMDESGDDSGIFWPVYYGCRPYDLLILQDLSVYGYKNSDRRGLLDIKHTELALRHLAKFHALSVAILEKGKINPKGMIHELWHEVSEFTQHFYVDAFGKLTSSMKDWGSEWDETRRRLESASKTLQHKIVKLGVLDPSRMNVINHGDYWVNNILFKCDPQTGDPLSLKAVDYQVCHHNTFAWDFLYFLYTSVKRELHREADLLALYHRALESNLKNLGLDGSKATLQNLRDEVERIEVYAVAVSTIILPITAANPANPADFSGFADGKSAFNTLMYSDPNYISIVQQDLKYFIEKGLV